MKVLVVKRDKIGDLLLTTPMLAHLRASLPAAEIHLLANDYNAWVVADDRNVDKRWVYRRWRTGGTIRPCAALQSLALSLRLVRERFDVAIAANGSESPRAIGRALATRATRVIAYAKNPAQFRGLTDALPEPRDVHEVDRLLALLAPLGVAPPREAAYPRYELPQALRTAALEWLGERGLRPGEFVVLGLGARRAKKQPSSEQILRWSERIARDHRMRVVLMWTPGAADNPLYPGDDAVVAPVLAASRAHIEPFRGALLPAIGLVWHARTSLFPDSGLMHFAAASPGGVLGFFAETDVSPSPTQWAPRGPRAHYLEARTSVSELDDEMVFATLAPLLTDASPRRDTD